jgi:hypothetical protein
MRLRILVLGLAIYFSGCATGGVAIEESNYSVRQHRIAITSALGLIRGVSQNGRVIYSLYHDSKMKNIEVTKKTKERLHTKVTILGARRPYRVKVEVIVEARDPDTLEWQVLGTDENLEKRRANAIKEKLALSRDETSLFDEEQPF